MHFTDILLLLAPRDLFNALRSVKIILLSDYDDDDDNLQRVDDGEPVAGEIE